MALAAMINSPLAPDLGRLPEPQTRGYFLNIVQGISPTSLRQEVNRAAQAGFNLIIFPIYNNGWTNFPSNAALSQKLPAINPLFKKWNPLAHLAQYASDAGLTVWGFARPYYFHPRHSVSEQKLLDKHPGWRVRAHPEFINRQSRKFVMRHPCPLNDDYQRFVGDLLAEVVAGYPLDGMVIDFSGFGLRGHRLADAPYCFCNSCVAKYYDVHRSDMADDAQGDKLDQVRIWQYQETHEHLGYLRHRLMRSRRTLRLICWTPPLWRQDAVRTFDPVHELPIHWPSELSTGNIDELIIHHDGEDDRELFSARLAADYAYLGDRVLFLPVLSVNQAADLAVPLAALQKYHVPGFIAQFQDVLSEEDATYIRSCFFPAAAPIPETEPIRTAAFLLERVRLAHEDMPVIHDLISDFLRLLARQYPFPQDFPTLEMIEQNLHGLEQYIRRGRLGQYGIPERTMRDLGLARRFVRLACMDVRS